VEAASTWELVTGLVLIACSAFFSGSETALTALGDARAHQLMESGGRRGKLLAVWVKSPERVLSTLLIGNTLVNIGAGALAGDLAHDVAAANGWSQATLLAIATAIATSLILFLGEIIPKTIGKRHPIQWSLSAIPVVQVFYWLFWPLTSGLVRATNALVSVFGGVRPPTPAVTSAEIEYLIEVGTREGVLDEVKEELLNSVLEFADRVVKEVMVPRTRMAAIDRDAPPDEILRIVTENPYSRMPVYRDSIDNVVGILLVREIIPELAQGPKGVLATLDRHLKPPFFVPEQMKISKLLKEMQKRKTHLAIVVDEFGGTSGLATLEDVIEEIVGEIQDEGDVEAAPVREVAPAVYLAEASVPLRELEDYLNERSEADGDGAERRVTFPEEGDYETLGGFVTATAGRVPPVGSLLAWDGLTFTVRAGDERRVTKVEIARRREAEPAEATLERAQGAPSASTASSAPRSTAMGR
jgi:CBS domain containing-hemolysin-like protein